MRVSAESLTISLTGALTAASVDLVRSELIDLVATRRPDELHLDLSGVHTMDAAGAVALLETRTRLRRRGAGLRLVRPSPAVTHFLETQPRFARLLVPPDVGDDSDRVDPRRAWPQISAIRASLGAVQFHL